MKKFYSIAPVFALSLLSASCNSGAGKTEASDSANATQDIVNTGGSALDSATNMSGSNLIASNDCFTCHTIDKKSVGPSYMQIAKQYDNNEGNVENLAHKIIKGGKGLWGQNAMNPHPNLSQAEAQAMSRYILSLNNPTLK